MVVYEVTAMVADELSAAFERYMQDGHMEDVLATGCFSAASIETSGHGRYRMRYIADDLEALDKYLSEHAPDMRTDFAERFPSGVELSREHWIVLGEFA